MKRILIACPHLDDETLGCGGLLASLQTEGVSVRIALFSQGGAGLKWKEGTYEPYSNVKRWTEFEKACKILAEETQVELFDPVTDHHHKFDTIPRLAMVKFLEDEIKKFAPTLFLIPYAGYDQDHQAVNAASLVCCRSHFYAGSVWEYSVGSESDFLPNAFVVLTPEQAQVKADAFAQYGTQQVKSCHLLSNDSVTDTLKRHGRLAFTKFAEGYRIIREVR